MTDEELLIEMRKQYDHATIEDHMLVDGAVRLRCRICRTNPLPHVFGSVLWCNGCIDEYLAGKDKESMKEFIERKRRAQ